jgi:ribosomal protein S12 methylthiotransferase accessory factor
MRKLVGDANPGRLDGVLGWVDERFGPIRRLTGKRLLPPEPAWWVYVCDLPRAPAGSWYDANRAAAAGTSIEPDEALQRVLGEAVERYSGMNPGGALEELPLTAKESSLFQCFPACAAEEPCSPSFSRVDQDIPLTHVLVRQLADDRQVAIPAGHVHLNFQPQNSEPPITVPVSTGLAFHPELHQAIWNGLCEVAERDAMMLMWWTRHAARALDCRNPDLPAGIVTRLERLERVGLRTHLYDMSTEFRVPTVFCVIAGRDYPYWVTGAACRTDPIAACAKALDEAASARLSARRFAASAALPSLDKFDWVCSLEAHEFLYAHWRATPAFDFLIHQGKPPLSYREFARQEWWPQPQDMDDLVALSTRLRATDLTVLWTEITAPEAKEFGRVVKVIVPQMVPLPVDHNARWLATPRLQKAARSKDWPFNPYPHPFA